MSARTLAAVAGALTLAAGVAAGASGCSRVTLTSLPDGIAVSVHQNRPDTEDRRLQVRITNGSESAVTITSLEFASPRFAEAAEYAKAPTTIRSGGVTDLPVDLPPPECSQSDPDAQAHVTIDFVLHDGHSGSASVVPDDPLTQLDGISERDCLDVAISRVAAITPPDELRVETIEGRPVANLDVSIAPTGADGAFTIESVDDTVLFGLHDPASATPAENLSLGIDVHGDDPPRTLTIPLVPARCDAHAVAEDKRGTLMPLRVTTQDSSGIVYLAMPESVKGQLYEYLNGACTDR